MDLNFTFHSSEHIRYEAGKVVSGPNLEANRVITIEPNINGCPGYNIQAGVGYIVTVYNMDGQHPVWKDNIQMSPKVMKIVSKTSDLIVLKGFPIQAKSPFGWVDFNGQDYGLTLYLKNSLIDKCILHMYDRNIDIEYLSKNKKIETSRTESIDLLSIQLFLNKFQNLSMNDKMILAQKSDELNNAGVFRLKSDDIDNAIDLFNKALSVLPINDDALQNLIICYEHKRDFAKLIETQTNLDFLRSIGL